MKYINPHDFYLETNGRIIDVDGAYGGQCWDLWALFCQKYCGRTFSCISTGYVIDLWNTFEQIGLDKYFDKVNILQDGDWAIWQGPCQITSKSHIAMFRLDNGNGTGIFLTQNPNGNPNYVHQMNISYQGMVGGLRPKTNQPKKEYVITEPVAENKDVIQLHVNCDNTMRCRTTAEINNDNCIGFYKTGFYNVLEEKTTDYHWCKLADDNWIACLEGYTTYIPKYVAPVVEEKPIEPPKVEEPIIEKPVIEEYIVPEPAPSENIIVKIVKLIIKIIKMVFGKDDLND